MTPGLFARLLAKPAGDLAATYIELRNRRDRYRAEAKQLQMMMDQLAPVIQQKMLDDKQDGFRAMGYTVYTYDLTTASVSDRKIFMDFVIAQQAFDLLEVRASREACETYAAENNRQLPPGVTINVIVKLGARKSS